MKKTPILGIFSAQKCGFDEILQPSDFSLVHTLLAVLPLLLAARCAQAGAPIFRCPPPAAGWVACLGRFSVRKSPLPPSPFSRPHFARHRASAFSGLKKRGAAAATGISLRSSQSTHFSWPSGCRRLGGVFEPIFSAQIAPAAVTVFKTAFCPSPRLGF